MKTIVILDQDTGELQHWCTSDPNVARLVQLVVDRNATRGHPNKLNWRRRLRFNAMVS